MTAGRSGSLVIVGTGFQVAGQVPALAVAEIRRADRLFYVVSEALTRQWLHALNPSAESLDDAYAAGKPRRVTYDEMVARMLAPVRDGERVCTAFYGHPGVFVNPSHEAIRQAREEGFRARMIPAISAEDCLFADLELDPTAAGCQSFEATSFLIHRRPFDPHAGLILWQVGAIGVRTFEPGRLWGAAGLEVLVEVLLGTYPADHETTVYEASDMPIGAPRMDRVPLGALREVGVTTTSTLYIPPLGPAPEHPDWAARLEACRR